MPARRYPRGPAGDSKRCAPRRTNRTTGLTTMAERILIVDDDPQVQEVLTRFLGREGYTPVAVGTGEAALEVFRTEPPDLVLLDLCLPGIDGFQVCRRLKENEATALIPVTILTGSQLAEARTRAIEAGADDVLTKPFDYFLLRARLRA